LNVFLQKTNISWDWGFESCRGHGGAIIVSGIQSYMSDEVDKKIGDEK